MTKPKANSNRGLTPSSPSHQKLPTLCSCGQPMATHPYCPRCTISVGPGHLETKLVDGICGDCAKRKT